MDALVARLSDAYARQADLYARVLALVEGERDALCNRRPLGEIIDSLVRKRRLLAEIGGIERAIAADKAAYRERRARLELRDTRALSAALERVREVVQRIIAEERENEERILSAADAPAGAMVAGSEGP
jgi:flagellar biosynthesis/type III secretory pathway chaperone